MEVPIPDFYSNVHSSSKAKLTEVSQPPADKAPSLLLPLTDRKVRVRWDASAIRLLECWTGRRWRLPGEPITAVVSNPLQGTH